jgi:hypothetical protein
MTGRLYDQFGSDNIFAAVLRKLNVPYKYQMITEKKFEYYTETNKGFGMG